MTNALRFLNAKFNLFYAVACAITFTIVLIRSYAVPFAHDEVATFYYYIQSESFLPFSSHIDANGHFLNSLVSWISYKCFGTSEFALRLPGLFAFLVLCFGVHKFNRSFQSVYSKLILTSAFILSFNILNFYSLCRGYGLSISFLLTGLYYFFAFLKSDKFTSLVKAFIALQLALSANLTLVFLLLLVGGIAILFQLKNKQLFQLKNVLLYIPYFILIGFWVKYAFYLQENGALYYGGGNAGYFTVTFKSLMDTVFIKSGAIYLSVLLIFTALAIFWLIQFAKNKLVFLIESRFGISFFMLFALVIAFYLLKLLFHVNYPEDRTGLFFYVLFILSLSFLFNEYESKTQLSATIIPLFFVGHFVLNVNFSKHGWGFYETMPKRFFETLLNEQAKSKELITVGGHRVLELFYAFNNYNSSKKLNHMLPPELMEMNCDYYVTWKKDKPYYDPYYDEMDTDPHWNMVLLKRKEPIERKLVYENNTLKEINGSDEYYSYFERIDTLLTSPNPILAEFDISIEKASSPLNAWLVLQVDSANGGPTIYFRRAPLNWMNYNWEGTTHFKTCIQTDVLPLHRCRIAAFLWNIDKKEIKMKINSLKLYHLNAKGITEASKAIE